MQNLRELGRHIALGQAGTKEQGAGQGTFTHENGFCPRDLIRIGPLGQLAPLFQVVA